MFVRAIETATKYTRPFKSICRCYGQTKIEKGCATFVIVNDDGWILTCKHVAEQYQIAVNANKRYSQFKNELMMIPKSDEHYETAVRSLEKKYGYDKNENTLIQQKILFVGVVDKMTGFEWHYHPKYDIALIHFKGFERILCNQYPIFAKDSSVMKQGMSLCRLGYPYPEFADYRYNQENDNIEWTDEGRTDSPLFPIDGIVTRFCTDNDKVVQVELSTPGLKGQSGGPLFDINGVIYGIQSVTVSLPLGFDQENREIVVKGIKKKVNDYSFIHLGRCVHIDIIKAFMDEHGVKYKVED